MTNREAVGRLAELREAIVTAYNEAIKISNEEEIPFELYTGDLAVYHEPDSWNSSDSWYDSGC